MLGRGATGQGFKRSESPDPDQVARAAKGGQDQRRGGQGQQVQGRQGRRLLTLVSRQFVCLRCYSLLLTFGYVSCIVNRFW